MNIIRGKQAVAQKVVVYGPEGIGKSTFASEFPNPLFLDTEGSTNQLDIARLEKASSWNMFVSQVQGVMKDPMGFQTLVIDTIDWAERLCGEHICNKGDQKGPKTGLEDFGYGRGYVFLAEEIGRLLNALSTLTERGINVVLLGHAGLKRFERPEEIGSYDRWELKLEKKTAPLVKEWSDILLFADYETTIIDIDGKKKAQNGQRVMHTEHRPWWDAKNRFKLDPKLPFSFDQIKHCILDKPTKLEDPVQVEREKPVLPQDPDQIEGLEPNPDKAAEQMERLAEEASCNNEPKDNRGQAFHAPLYDLMNQHNVSDEALKSVIVRLGHFPDSITVDTLPEDYVNNALIPNWNVILEKLNIK